MIVPRTYNPIKTLFVFKGSSLERTWRRITAATLVALAVTATEIGLQLQAYSLSSLPFTLVGLALSIFLGFRTNAAYDRWWEGRKLWGGIVNISRSYARQLQTFVDDGEPRDGSPRTLRSDTITDQTTRTIAWVHSLQYHLRTGDLWKRGVGERLAPLLSADEIAELKAGTNVPINILHSMGLRLRDARQAGQLTDYQAVLLERSLQEMTALQGGCERIRNTPVPWGYTVLLHRLVFFYCFALPFGIVDEVGWATPVVVMLVSQALFGLDEIIIDIQEPFDDEPNSLPLNALAVTIESNLRDVLDQPADMMPQPAQPVDGVLW